MENLKEIIDNIILSEKLASEQRIENKRRVEQVINEKNLEISTLEQKIKKLKNDISSAQSNLIIPTKVHVLFSKDVGFKILASMYFYNPNEGYGDPNWRSADREEHFNEDALVTIKSATVYFVNAHYNLPIDENDKKLHEKTNLALAFDFDYIRASGTLWAYYRGDSKSVFDFTIEFEAKSFKEKENLGHLKLDSEQLVRCTDGLLEHMAHVYGQLYLPAEKNGMHYEILGNIKKVHRNMISEAVS